MQKVLIIFCLLVTGYPCFSKHGIDTFHLYFDLNVPQLNKNMERKVDLLMYNGRILSGSSVMVIGYADYLGSEGYNKNLSMMRAKNVRDYLVKNGINSADIKMCLGKGEIERKEMVDAEGSPDDRRVDIVVNNIVTSETSYRPTITFNTPKAPSKPTSKTTPKSKVRIDTASLANLNTSSQKDIKELATLKEGQTITLRNVYFPPGSHMIKPESYTTLEKLYKVLLENSKLRISIEGHVCCVHDVPDAIDIDTNEPILSVNRARSIYLYLVNKGIDSDRLQYTGFGRDRPVIYYERSEEDATVNRRVEIRIIK